MKKLALIGPFAANGYEMIGCWRGYGKSENAVQLEHGFKAALPKAEVTVVKGCSASTEPITKTLQDGSVVALHEADKEFDLDACVAAANAPKRNAKMEMCLFMGKPSSHCRCILPNFAVICKHLRASSNEVINFGSSEVCEKVYWGLILSNAP